MTDFLVATSSVHVTAAAADYLEQRLEPAEDSVTVVAVREADAAERDAGDAANVARSRLVVATPEVDIRDGNPAQEILDAIDEQDPDEVVIGTHGGTEGTSGLGTTAAVLLESVDRPVVVVPVPTLE